MRVALFITCLNDTLFPQTGRAVVRILRRLGHDVVFPREQTCCGQMHLNTGYRDEAIVMMRRFSEVFEPFDVVVTPSGSCAAMAREQYPKLGVDPDLVSRVYDLSELLVDVLGVTDVGAYFPHRVAYHATCHSSRSLRLGERPLQLLSAVRGLRLADLVKADECCGFGGTFAVKNPSMSAAMCADKCSDVMGSGAEVLCATDNSCLMHIGGALSRQSSGIHVMHLAEILASTESST